MFDVISRRTGITYTVYAVDSNRFLIFSQNRFTWYNSDLFRPTKTTEQERLEKENRMKGTNTAMMFKSQKQRAEVVYP